MPIPQRLALPSLPLALPTSACLSEPMPCFGEDGASAADAHDAPVR